MSSAHLVPTSFSFCGPALHYVPGENPRWKISGSAEAVMLAERLFSGFVSRRADVISFPATRASFNDLRMIVDRFQLKIECDAIWSDFESERLNSERWKAAPDSAVDCGPLFKGTLLPFQRSGVRFMLAARKGLLADDMGLGKTVQALAFAAALNEWPLVIVCQAHMISHWEEKSEQFLQICDGSLSLLSRHSLTFQTLRGSVALSQSSVYLVHYLNLHRWINELTGMSPAVAIFDECQELRHPGTRKHEASKKLALASSHVFGLSGTPIYNRGGEIFEVLSTLDKGCLGSRNSFRQQWCEWPDIVKEPELLGQYLRDRGVMLRRRKDEVLTDLPAKRRVIEHVSADNKLFAEFLKEAIELAKKAEAIANPFDRARMENEALAHTRRATGMAKAESAAAFLAALLEAGETVLCFSHHHAVHDTLCDALADHNPARITGRESMAEKDASKAAFQRGDTNIIMISLRAATGIDGLQHRARCVVFVELDWSPAVHRQAEDRAHRMGVKDSILVYYLVTDLGTDPDMISALGLKESQFLGLMHEKNETTETRTESNDAAKSHMANVLARLRGAGR